MVRFPQGCGGSSVAIPRVDNNSIRPIMKPLSAFLLAGAKLTLPFPRVPTCIHRLFQFASRDPQLRNPALTGKPVVVVQYPTSRHDIEDMRPDDNRVVEGSASSIIAVSYEARPSGVRLKTRATKLLCKSWASVRLLCFSLRLQSNQMFVTRSQCTSAQERAAADCQQSTDLNLTGNTCWLSKYPNNCCTEMKISSSTQSIAWFACCR